MKKLKLKKEVLLNINNDEMSLIKGGIDTTCSVDTCHCDPTPTPGSDITPTPTPDTSDLPSYHCMDTRP